MAGSPVVVGAPNGGWDLLAIRPDHGVSHAFVPTPAGVSNPTWTNLGGIVYEIDAAYDKAGLLVILARGGPAGPGGLDQLYVKTRSANGWGDWIRVGNLDVC